MSNDLPKCKPTDEFYTEQRKQVQENGNTIVQKHKC